MTILGWVLALAALVNGTLLLFGYLSNQVFPQPLNEADERMYLDKMRAGREEARNKLI